MIGLIGKTLLDFKTMRGSGRDSIKNLAKLSLYTRIAAVALVPIATLSALALLLISPLCIPLTLGIGALAIIPIHDALVISNHFHTWVSTERDLKQTSSESKRDKALATRDQLIEQGETFFLEGTWVAKALSQMYFRNRKEIDVDQ